MEKHKGNEHDKGNKDDAGDVGDEDGEDGENGHKGSKDIKDDKCDKRGKDGDHREGDSEGDKDNVNDTDDVGNKDGNDTCPSNMATLNIAAKSNDAALPRRCVHQKLVSLCTHHRLSLTQVYFAI